jgi:hypothetical protein
MKFTKDDMEEIMRRAARNGDAATLARLWRDRALEAEARIAALEAALAGTSVPANPLAKSGSVADETVAE